MSARAASQLVIVLGLEQAPRCYLVSASLEDEVRLLLWLERTEVLDQLPERVRGAFAELGGEEAA